MHRAEIVQSDAFVLALCLTGHKALGKSLSDGQFSQLKIGKIIMPILPSVAVLIMLHFVRELRQNEGTMTGIF